MVISQHLQLVKVQRMRDCGILSPKWKYVLNHFPPEVPASLQKRGQKECKSQKSEMTTRTHNAIPRALTMVVTAYTRPVQVQARQHLSMERWDGHEVSLPTQGAISNC